MDGTLVALGNPAPPAAAVPDAVLALAARRGGSRAPDLLAPLSAAVRHAERVVRVGCRLDAAVYRASLAAAVRGAPLLVARPRALNAARVLAALAAPVRRA